MREEEERRSRALEPPGASSWKLEGLQEPWKGLSCGRVEEHRGVDKHAYTSSSFTSSSWWWPRPSLPLSSSPSVLQLIPARAECLLRGLAGRGRRRGKVRELSASFCREVQQVGRWRGLKLRETEEGVGGVRGCSW